MDPQPPPKKAEVNEALRGQDNPDAAEAVRLQREAKKAAKAAKIAKKLGTSEAGDADTTDAKADAGAAVAAPAAAAPAAASPAAQQAPPPPVNEALRGQDSAEAAEAVRLQREAKKAAKQEKIAKKLAGASDDAAPAAQPAPAAPQKTKAATAAPAAAVALPPVPVAAPAATVAAPAAAAAAAVPLTTPMDLVDPATPAVPLGDSPNLSSRVVQLGLLLQTHRIVGANARCVAVLMAIIDAIRTSSEIKSMYSLTRQNSGRITTIVKEHATFLSACRPFTPGMQWLLKVFQDRIGKTADRPEPTKAMPEAIATQHLRDLLTDMTGSIADVVATGVKCINSGDVVLTYGRSSSIEQALITAGQTLDFTVIVVDSGPLYEGRGMQWRLQQRGIKTSYVLLSAVCATMTRCTKVLIGAAAILQNGQIVGRAGTAAVSLVAKQFRKPLLCFCETYKFTERVWSAQTRDDAHLASYDTTPKDLVDIIVSDIGFLHPSAVAAAIRDRNEREDRYPDPFA